jgi:spermidine/putrescine transport system substrate-binding protein
MRGLTRRSLLRGAGAFAGAWALGACAGRERRVDGSARLPLLEDVPRIDADAPLERGGTLRVYQWRDYLSTDVLDGFVRRHASADAEIEVESFTSIAEAAERLRAPDGDFDVFFPTPEALPSLVGAGLLRPLTHELLPNVSNLWPFFLADGGPFYDVGQRYSVPYTVYATGIGWRRDLVRADDAPDRLENPYDAYWNERYRGAVGIYDDYREGLALALLRAGRDPNAAAPDVVDRAVDDLLALAAAVDVEVSAEGAGTSCRRSGSGRSQPTMPAASRSPGHAAASSAAT